MHMLTRRSVPALLATLAVSASTSLEADPAADPVHAAIAAAQDALKEHDQCFDMADQAEQAFFAQSGKLPRVTYAGLTFHTRAEVDAPIMRRALADEIRQRMAAQGLPVAPAHPDRYGVPVEWETYRARVHRDMTTYLRARDELNQVTGMTKAQEALSVAGDALCKAESAVFDNAPTTSAGAASLARFAIASMRAAAVMPTIESDFFMSHLRVAADKTVGSG
ncbi:MAG: hypothetical protein JWL62_3115 [Hyphomicrobiales bacterium]|nr:hypothetical protein [Hyphomicrobiales bacterium]